MKQNSRPSKTWLIINLSLALLLIGGGKVMLWWVRQQASNQGERKATTNFAQQSQQAIDFTLPSLSETNITLSDYRGQVVLVNFWASWCPPCIAELPAINTFYERKQEQGLVVLAINDEEDKATIEDFMADKGFSFTVLLDSKGTVMKGYGVMALPVSFIIDRNGFIRHIHRGELSPQQLEDLISPLLSVNSEQ